MPLIVDIAVPADMRIAEEELEKVEMRRLEKENKMVVGAAMCKSCFSSDWCPRKRYKRS